MGDCRVRGRDGSDVMDMRHEERVTAPATMCNDHTRNTRDSIEKKGRLSSSVVLELLPFQLVMTHI